MLAHHFVKWCETASTVERCAGVALLAEAVIERKFLPKETREAEAALLYALDDVSPRVRQTIARIVAKSDRVSRQLVQSLARDVDEVAVPVVAQSPLLFAADLVDLARRGSRAVRIAIARRPGLGDDVCRALVVTDDADAALELLANRLAAPSADTLRRVADRFGHDGRVREILLERADLPADTRHLLLQSLTQALGNSSFVLGVLGAERGELLRRDLEERAMAAVVEDVRGEDIAAFVEHLRSGGALTAAMLLKSVCSGRIDLFAAALARLTGHSERRVRAIIAEARQPSFGALASSAGLPPTLVPLLLAAIRVWKDASMEEELDPADVTASVMQRLLRHHRREADVQQNELLEMLQSLSNDAQRLTARARMERYLAA